MKGVACRARGVLIAVSVVAVVALSDAPAMARNAPSPAPSAASFAAMFVRATNSAAFAHHDARRVGGADCVEPTTGHYMCSYLAITQAHGRECHLMQARWTPLLASTITVTLAGRVHRCDSLLQALRSLP